MKKSSKGKKQQQQQQPLWLPGSGIKLPPKAHVELVRCRVLLLGRAAPTETRDGVMAMQKPLCELYADYSTVESIITAYTSGIVIRTPADVHAGAEELWFPIQDLLECGAMRPVGGTPPTAFVPLSYPEAEREREREAMFAFVMKRRDIPTADCWAVVCKSDKAAMALLTASMMAHKNTAGWASAVDRPPSTINREFTAARAPPVEEWDGAAAKEAAQWTDKYPRDYYEKPPLQGFYYTPKNDLIQRYAVSELNPQLEEMMLDERRLPFADDQRPPRLPVDAYCPCDMADTLAPRAHCDDNHMYGFPPGTMGTVVPESLIYPNNERCCGGASSSSSDSDAQRGKTDEWHGKKKKSKKSKHKKKKKSSPRKENEYEYYTEDGRPVLIMPQQAMSVHGAPSTMNGEPFESRLPQQQQQQQPVDHYVVDEEYDPSWHYNMKSYIRHQQPVNGFTGPTVGRPYESHIQEMIPPADYAVDETMYSDSGLYERRLPVSGGKPAGKADHKMLNRNFIMRQSEDYRRHL